MFSNGHILYRGGSDELQIVRQLGEGTQGVVYLCEDTDGQQSAVKWFSADNANREQYAIVDKLIRQARESHPGELFCWPNDWVFESPHRNNETAASTGYQGSEFGYQMPLVPNGWFTLGNLARREPPEAVQELDLQSLYCIAFDICRAFRELHVRGLAYRDVSHTNVLYNPSSSEIVLIDNDNAVHLRDGSSSSSEVSVRGTGNFMAPEIVRREQLPDVKTDRHSMAVLLFYVFVGGHPLHGAREHEPLVRDEASDIDLYGTNPVFVFDPEDHSNHPVDGIHDRIRENWASLPTYFQVLFQRAFGEGLLTPSKRVVETEWMEAIKSAEDHIVSCGSCGVQNVFDEPLYREAGFSGICWACDAGLQAPLLLSFGTRTMAVTPKSIIRQYHLDQSPGGSLKVGREAVALVIEHPDKPGRFGFKNVGGSVWKETRTDGERAIEPGGVVRIRKDTTFHIDGMEFSLQQPG